MQYKINDIYIPLKRCLFDKLNLIFICLGLKEMCEDIL